MASGGGLTDLILRCLVFWFGFRCSSFEEGISMAFDGSENPQKGPRSAQVSVPPLKVGRRRIGIPGNFIVLKVHIAEVILEDITNGAETKGCTSCANQNDSMIHFTLLLKLGKRLFCRGSSITKTEAVFKKRVILYIARVKRQLRDGTRP